jgi:hypothetical protein
MADEDYDSFELKDVTRFGPYQINEDICVSTRALWTYLLKKDRPELLHIQSVNSLEIL